MTGEDQSMPVTEPPAPPVTDALRAQAKANPGTWVYAIDPGFDPAGNVPPEGIVGAWQSDENGELGGDFMPNPRYLPTPQARGWEEPSTPLERVLQLVLCGYLADDRLPAQFARSEVFIYSRDEGGIFLAPAKDGGQVAYAFTDAAKADASGYARHEAVSGDDFAAALPDGVRIALNPGAHVSAIIRPSEVRA